MEKLYKIGIWEKGLFHVSETSPWLLSTIKDYGNNEQPHQILHWVVIDNQNNLKLFTTFYSCFTDTLYDTLKKVIDAPRIQYVVGSLSKQYDLTYFIKYLTDHNIEFNKEMNDNNEWKLFY